MAGKPKTIDDYLARISPDERPALEALREAIRGAAPKAEECISYQLPAFRLDGRMLLSFGAATNHCAFYPGAFPIAAHRTALKGYDTGKGTIRFQAAKRLPASLVRKLVKARVAENRRSRAECRPYRGVA